MTPSIPTRRSSVPRIRGGQTTSPITTISRRDAERAGQTDLGQVIRDLPQNFSGGQNPTIAPTGQGSFSNVSGSSTLNLRGLGPDASLTLLNGHRVAFDAISQGIDISAIPLAAIESVRSEEHTSELQSQMRISYA